MAGSAAACGEERSSPDLAAGRRPGPIATERPSWSREGRHRNQGPDVMRVEVALHPDGRYEAASHGRQLEPITGSGTRSAEAGRSAAPPGRPWAGGRCAESPCGVGSI